VEEWERPRQDSDCYIVLRARDKIKENAWTTRVHIQHFILSIWSANNTSQHALFHSMFSVNSIDCYEVTESDDLKICMCNTRHCESKQGLELEHFWTYNIWIRYIQIQVNFGLAQGLEQIYICLAGHDNSHFGFLHVSWHVCQFVVSGVVACQTTTPSGPWCYNLVPL